MATQYSFCIEEGDKFEFWCNNKEIRDDVRKYIENCIDAVKWRERVERISAPPIRIKDEEGE